MKKLNHGWVEGSAKEFLGLSDAAYRYNHPQTSAIGDSLLFVHGAHEFTFGGDFSRRENNLLSQSNPRGTLQFTGFDTALNGNTTNGGELFVTYCASCHWSPVGAMVRPLRSYEALRRT